jgi:RsiW-degrading membrane proteinase PrsW (M82 family)
MNFKREEMLFGIFFSLALIITVLHFLYHPVRVLGMNTSIFYMDEKITLAAYFTTVVSFLTGFLFMISSLNIPKVGGKEIKIKDRLYTLLGIFFIVLSIDEYFEIHEFVNQMIKDTFSGNIIGNIANFSWVFPLIGIIIAIFILFALIFIKEKDKNIKIPLFLGIVCFLFVLILEPIGGSTFGNDIYVLFVGLEEGLEMLGGTFFLLSSLRRLYRSS